jgi:hypothetical protein
VASLASTSQGTRRLCACSVDGATSRSLDVMVSAEVIPRKLRNKLEGAQIVRLTPRPRLSVFVGQESGNRPPGSDGLTGRGEVKGPHERQGFGSGRVDGESEGV